MPKNEDISPNKNENLEALGQKLFLICLLSVVMSVAMVTS